MINNDERWSTAEVASRLGVKPATVYAYVSRGLLHSERGPRGSTFDPAEVERVARGTRLTEEAGRSARDLSFVTRLTRVEDGRFFYRGRDAVVLSRERSFEEVAWFLWTGQLEAQEPWAAPPEIRQVARRAVAALGGLGLPIERLRVAVAAAATADPLRRDRSAPAVALTGRSLLAGMVDSLPAAGGAGLGGLGGGGGGLPPDHEQAGDLADRLWARLCAGPPTPAGLAALQATLVLIADHELAPSTLAARVAAAFRADPYAVVSSGLGAAGGPLHSGASSEVRGLLSEAAESGAARAIGRHLDRDLPPPGFGQPLYPAGDPRATELLRRFPDLELPAERAGTVADVLALGARQGSPPPNVDFAVGALEWALDMIPGAGQAICVVGRTAGWLAHALEEYQERSSFRVRAAYVGPR